MSHSCIHTHEYELEQLFEDFDYSLQRERERETIRILLCALDAIGGHSVQGSRSDKPLPEIRC